MFVGRCAGNSAENGQQVLWGLFLVLMVPKENDLAHPHAMLQWVTLEQFGHFMVGDTTLLGENVALSGEYGGDGCPVSVSRKLYDAAVPVPRPLYGSPHEGGETGRKMDIMAWAQKNRETLLADPRCLRCGGEIDEDAFTEGTITYCSEACWEEFLDTLY